MEQVMNKPLYARFEQLKSTIQGVQAIDYFFAKEMFSALNIAVGNEENAGKVESADNEESAGNLYHLFLALSASLRAGHSCLSLTDIADSHWGKGYAAKPVENTTGAVGVNNQAAQQSEQHAELQAELQSELQANEQTALTHPGFIFAPVEPLQNMLIQLNITPEAQQPVVLSNGKLYLRRYFQFEQELGQAINTRLSHVCQFDTNAIEKCISSIFPSDIEAANTEPASQEIDWQKLAVANAINKDFSVIAGGPGTGKTYTVTKLLAALIMLDQQNSGTADSTSTNHELNIALVAPTGKAAQRLSESIVDAVAGFKNLIDENVLAKIPTQAQTIHRLLGVIPNSPNFRHHENNRLGYDVLLIDEVSMVDLPLMTRIFRALKPSTKVILLGDADQLPSVAAGSVLADIAPRPHSGYSNGNSEYLAQVCHLTPNQVNDPIFAVQSNSLNDNSQASAIDYLSFLVKSRRFDGKGGIGLIANEVIKGQAKASWQRLSATIDAHIPNITPDITGSEAASAQLTLADGELSQWLQPLVKKYYQPITSCADVSDAFNLLAQFRVLCATRQGEYGVERLNDLIKGYLGKGQSPYQQGLHSQQKQSLYHGQPIMINENDYRLGLYNGDIGIIWQVEDKAGKKHLMACFEDNSFEGSFESNSFEGNTLESNSIESDGLDNDSDNTQKIRQILPSRLPKYETVYAMTIHKTQGSEFSHVAMVLSASDTDVNAGQQSGSKLLTRELLYTGITRAKKFITICSSQSVWQQGVIGQVKRSSGLQLY